MHETLLIVHFLHFRCKIGCDIFLKVEVKKETPVTSSAAVSAAEKKEMSAEREELEKERQRMNEERSQMEEDRKNYGGEKKEWMDQINKLQQDIVILTKVRNYNNLIFNNHKCICQKVLRNNTPLVGSTSYSPPICT